MRSESDEYQRARRRLHELWPKLQIVAQAANSFEAAATIAQHARTVERLRRAIGELDPAPQLAQPLDALTRVRSSTADESEFLLRNRPCPQNRLRSFNTMQ